MEQTLFEIMWENTPTITFVIIVMVATTFVTVKAVKFYSRFERVETKLDELDKKVDIRLTNLETHANATDVKLAVMDAKLDALINTVSLLSDTVNRLSDRVNLLTDKVNLLTDKVNILTDRVNLLTDLVVGRNPLKKTQ